MITILSNFINKIVNKLFIILLRPSFAALGKRTFLSRKAIIKGKDRIKIGENCTIYEFATLDAANDNDSIEIGNNTIVHEFSFLKAFDGKIKIGEDCTINPFCLIYGCEKGIEIGNGVRIATGASMVANSHVFKDPNTYFHKQGVTSKGIRIEDDVWIASGVRIIDGVTIGKGSIIGANSVVTKNIPPYSIAVGVPARVIKERLEEG